MTQTIYDTLIIGAGIAGLLAARDLQAAGHTVVVLEKSRGVGGRMATRRLSLADTSSAVIDHGAQYFTARRPQFQDMVAGWQASGLLQAWSTDFATDSTPAIRPGPVRYSGVTGMTAVPKALAAGLDIRLQTTVGSVTWKSDPAFWHVHSEMGHLFQARSLLLTAPVPQSLALLGAEAALMPPAALASLTAVSYDPCLALLAILDGPSRIPEPGGLWPNEHPDLIWLADNQQKGISALPAITIHASPEFSHRFLEADADEVGQRLLAAAAPWLGAKVIDHQIHRWRYSIPAITHNAPSLFLTTPGPVAFAGDAFNGPRVEGAALSGLAASKRLRAWLDGAGLSGQRSS